MSVIHDKLMPLGLSRSESSISYNAVIDRTLPIEGMKVADVVLEDDEEEEEEPVEAVSFSSKRELSNRF